MALIPKILIFAGSIRTGAYSGKTADVAYRTLALQGADVTRISLGDYPLPIFDQDLEKEKGIPENALLLSQQIAAHDGVLIATPEYNGSTSPLLLNALAWLSRVRHDGKWSALQGKPAGLCSSSSGDMAGIRAINHLRAILVRCRMEVVMAECSVPDGGSAFDADGDFVHERLDKAMQALCHDLMSAARHLSVRIEP
ncbi:NAD(P)H-dependent oxidoreductase [Mesorhizobium sp. BE184]|uniref:NADPH-dependent FMN reductase n=1 Tax=Mesorhizobium sp. BE184 TaxID=2817714 RepID=UPI002854587B|nr:NAD(P)H-dependent oxidoreductase [Mesorhizobium sp. BE184]MDR7033578.1 NAD(P)H-dependent FMN reductase [Mesorhizobium sp. BE184]